MSNIAPKKLAIFYGYPTSVSPTYDVSGAVNVFKNYDIIVLGATLEELSHPDHNNTLAIIADPLMVNTEVFGYINSSDTINTIQTKIDKWYDMGVKGIFADRFGYDFDTTREKQREIVWCIHEKGNGNLKAYVNSFNIDDAFNPAVDETYNPDGLETRLGASDLYLAESFAIINGNYDDNDSDSNNIKDWQDKAIKMIDYRTTYGTKMTAIATGGAVFDQNKADYSYFSAVINGFDAWGYGEEYYSAASAQLPFRTRKEIIGTKFNGNLVINNGVYERQTNVGIHINTSDHTVNTLLD